MSGERWTAGKGSESRVEKFSQYEKNRTDIDMSGLKKKKGKKHIKSPNGRVTRYVYK